MVLVDFAEYFSGNVRKDHLFSKRVNRDFTQKSEARLL